MRGNEGIRAAGAEYVPDMEDWWGEISPLNAPGPRTRPRRRSARPLPVQAEPIAGRAIRRKAVNGSRVLMMLTLGVLVVCLFLQINRFAQIAAQSKHIASLVNEIKRLEGEESNLNLRLSARENIERVREEAMYNLKMSYPGEGQVRVVSLNVMSAETLAQMAAISADSAQ